MAKPIPQLSENEIKLFWSKVNIKSDEECWIWTAGISAGYGAFFIRSYKNNFKANRIAYFIYNKKDPGELLVLHNCPNKDNKLCVNPHHLWLGTNEDNMRDGVQKGQFAKGDQNPSRRFPEKIARGERGGNSKLTKFQVVSIRSKYTGERGQLRMLAKEFQVSPSLIRFIVHRESWKHIE